MMLRRLGFKPRNRAPPPATSGTRHPKPPGARHPKPSVNLDPTPSGTLDLNAAFLQGSTTASGARA